MMQAELFSCGVCGRKYDANDHIPKVIPSCGHTLCASCLNTILHNTEFQVCPLDNIPFMNRIAENQEDPFPINIVMMQLLEERSRLQVEVCEMHREPSNLICLREKHRICKVCATSNNHREHPIMHINDVRFEGNARKKYLESQVNEFQSCCNSLPYFLENEKEEIMESLRSKFEEMKTLLNKKEQEIILGVESFFEIEKVQLENKIEQDNQLQGFFKEKIAFLSNSIIGEKYLEVLKSEVPRFEIVPKYEELRKSIQENKNRFDEVLEKFNKALVSLLQQLQPKFPLCEPARSPRGAPPNSQEELNLLRASNFFHVSHQNERLVFSLKNKDMDVNSCLDFDSLLNQSRKINRVSIDFSKGEITESKTKALASHLKLFENLLDVQIVFSETEIQDQDLTFFCERSNWITSRIQSLKLDLTDCCIGDESLTRVSKKILAKLTKLKALKIYLSGTNITDSYFLQGEFLENISAKNLQELRLDFSKTQVTGLGIERVCNFLQEEETCKSIRVLDLNFGSIEIGDNSLKRLADLVFANMNLVQKLWLGFENIQVSSETIEYLFLSLQESAGNLKTFGLNMNLTSVTNGNIETLAEKVVLKMDKLEKFSLCLADTQVTDISIEKIFMNLHLATKNLKMFVLDLNRTPLTAGGIGSFVKQMLPAMNNLLRLEVSLEGIQITEGYAEKLFLGIKNIVKNLRVLTLNLNKTNISEKGTQLLNSMLIPGIELEKLSMSFAHLKTRNDFFRHLFETIENNLIKIKKIKFDLSYTQVSEQSIDTLLALLSNKLEILKDFSVNLDETEISQTKKDLLRLLQPNNVKASK